MEAQSRMNQHSSQRGFHQNSNSLADFRPTDPQFAQNAPPGLGNGMAGGAGAGTHRRHGTAHIPDGALTPGSSSTGTKNTSHVPCKFFREGKCQAGRGCQFSHAPEDFQRPAPCKYFSKGTCKYGYRCANPHILPNGQDARHMSNARNQHPYGERSRFTIGPPAQHGFGEQMPTNGMNDDLSTSPGRTEQFPYMDNGYNFNGSMQYGSPLNDSRQPISPPMRAQDAIIPPTFQDHPSALRMDAWPASMPSGGFAIGRSPPTTSTATPNAFANLGYMARPDATSHANGDRSTKLGSSPPNTYDKPLPNRMLQSNRLRQEGSIASSLPMSRPLMHRVHDIPTDESSDDESFGLLPGNLDDDILTPAERKRRASRSQEDAPHRTGLHSNPDSKYGSPTAHSPPAWGPLSARKHREDNQAREVYGSSPHGPIGSPLRNATLHPNSAATAGRSSMEKENANSPSIKPIPRPPSDHLNGDITPFGLASSPRSNGAGLSTLSQQLKNTRLRDVSASTEAGAQAQRLPSSRVVSGKSDRLEDDSDIFAMDSGDESDRGNLDPTSGVKPGLAWGAADAWGKKTNGSGLTR